MSKGRLEAFSDGVLAVIITIMVLNLKPPTGTSSAELRPLFQGLMSYVLSFLFVGIYWNNHHHLMQAVQKVNGNVLLANMHLLFWLSLFPFLTAWVGQTDLASWPMACYGVVLLLAAIAYTILVRVLIAHHGKNSLLAKAIGGDFKGYLSLGLYASAVPIAFYYPLGSYGIYFLVALIWIVPDRRIEKLLAPKPQ